MDTDDRVSPTSPPPGRTVLREFDWTSSESVCSAVANAVASVSNVDPTDIPPLYEVVDPDALDVLVSGHPERPGNDQVAVSFTFDDYRVTVTSSGCGYVDHPSSDRMSTIEE